MDIKEKIKENDDFSFYDEIILGDEIIIENKIIHPVYIASIIFYNEYVPSATIDPLAFLFKEKLKKKNDTEYEYYLIFFDDDYEKYTKEIIKKYNEKLEY
ncbi:hypothetical protein [uncultured Methanobrevibacter sp.]|uniref:hypothetical protein n=1 Tax=uncultured Methanobrevibacter sp. TaxID=253161 RepID=UPI0025E8659C|nr:hypothetical protein [uncultured Methanobrevibacter sp.]